MKIAKIIAGFLLVIAGAYVATWLPWIIVTMQVDIERRIDRLPQAEAIIVLGGLHDGVAMSETNRERLLTAKALYEAGVADRITVSNMEVASLAMRDFLIEEGVPEEVIEMDTTALVTEDTCINELALHPDGRSLIFVSQRYHLPRTLYLCRHAGVEGVGFPAEQLRLVERTRFSFWETVEIRHGRYWRENQLLLFYLLRDARTR